ncbi:related to VPS9 (involved in vacuole trafficking) [Sporisorium reilianum f. sp. reilianum]|uniref:Related to VPS9 (Involved in vacuole trafficking) n=1 Tax=Sporisorium reilianum f. sp. reilianum TaxID=72559 RepID=A0A2N8ULX8_9BASI|nr:related to VPS9 (involved in vacuole trafficking) [Sporisorium reilianum f. sp. reilianum]
MASSSEHIEEPSSDEVADHKRQSIVTGTPSVHDNETSAEHTSAHTKAEDAEEEQHTFSTTAETLAGDVDKLSLAKHDSHAGNAEVSDADTTATAVIEAETVPTEQQTDNEASKHCAEEEADDKALAKSDDKEAQEHAVGAADQPEPTTSSSTSEAPKSARLEKHQDEVAQVEPPSHVTTQASTSTDEPATVAPHSEEQPPSMEADSLAEDSSPPPTVPSKEAPQLPEKATVSATTNMTASTDAPSTPSAAQKAARSNREALADPESVAAVAHAFGRDSPALRSSTDTPQRIATPTDTARAAAEGKSDQAKVSSTDTPLKHTSDDAESSKAAPDVVASESEKVEEGVKGNETPSGGIRIGKGPPPTTQASEELPFDFNRFLEQMKHRSAQPVGEYVRSFIKGFAKKPYRTQDQIKLIFDFLDFIAARMRECDVWKDLGDSDFENTKEAMEKLVMNRLYPYTFTPAVQKEGRWAVQTDDLERDRVLRQRIGLFGWLSEEHLDVPVGDHSRGFIEFSIQELLKINHYKAPRDKLICILNCCKVIFGMIRHLSTQENADTFIPVLIFVVLKANPEHLISNVEYISRFRNPDRLSSESGYYLSSLMGAIAFIETMDYTSLSNITQEEFEKRVEEAVSSMAEPEASTAAGAAGAASEGSLLAPPTTPPPRGAQPPFGNAQHQRSVSANSVSAPSGPGEEAAKALPFTPMAASLADDTRAFFLRTGEAARTGLSRPMGALGRLINEGIEGIRTPSNNDSGASTERQNSPAPPPAAAAASAGMTASTSRSKLFGGLFGSLDTSDSATQPRAAGYPGQQGGRRSTMLIDDEPQTPSTNELIQDGFHPYQAGAGAGGPNAPLRLLRPNMPQRNYSIDDTMFDDESAGRRNLMATTAGSGRGQRDADYDDDDLDSEDGDASATAEQKHRRMRMQQDFGRGFHNAGTPSRPVAGAAGDGQLQAGRREDIAYETAQTEQAIQRSLIDQQRLDAVQADEAAQNSASVETLKSIFPTVDEGVIQMVLQGCEGNVETAIDRLLEMQ